LLKVNQLGKEGVILRIADFWTQALIVEFIVVVDLLAQLGELRPGSGRLELWAAI
jgi:hypothetical protein